MATTTSESSRSVVSKFAIALMMFFAAIILMMVYAAFPGTTHLHSLVSEDGRYTVRLSRTDWIDRNYKIHVNGRLVFRSADFAPSDSVPFRESLWWDTTGDIVILEVARHRIFGYDCAKQKPLSDDELLAVEIAPDPPLWQYHYETEWPGVGRTHRPEFDIDADPAPSD